MRHNPGSNPPEATRTRRPDPAGRPLGHTLRRYLFREPLLPGALALAGLTAALLAKDLLGFSDLVINRELGLGTVARIALYETVPLAARTLPFAAVVGALVGLGRLATDRELLALEACGISWRSLIPPVCAAAALATALGLALSLAAAPRAARSLDALLERIARERPATAIRAGPVLEFGDLRLQVREASSSGERLRGVLVWMPEVGDTIFAEEGSVTRGPGEELLLRLRDGAILLRPQRSARRIHFETLRTELPQGDVREDIEHDDPLRSLGPAGLAALSRESEDPELSRRAALTLHRGFALPFAALAFGILAVPLFLAAGRPSGAGGAVAGLIVTGVYYGLLQLGDGLAQGGRLGPAAAAWLPNAAVLGTALALLAAGDRLAERRGGAGGRREGRRGRGAGGIRARRFPLQRYVARQYLALSAIAFGALVTAYLITDVLERLDWLARHHAESIEVLRFYGARTPLLASRMVPMALLAGAALAVSRLAVRGELVAMRACGIAAARGLLPILFVAALAVPGDFLLNDVVVTRTNALADVLKETEIKEGGGPERAIWYREGDRVVRVSSLDPELGRASGVTLFELGEDGLPRARTDAGAARHVGGGIWELTDPQRIEISTQGIERVPADTRVRLSPDPIESADPMHLPVRELAAHIRAAESAGYDATRFRVDLQSKLAAPLACFVLPAVVLFLAIGGPPFPRPAWILVLSAALGVGYVLLSGVTTALGYGGTLPPAAAGWGASAAFAGVAAVLAARNRT